mgnify:CR=1 FL=1
MINYIKITFGILVVLSASRFIPHPPNFTSLITLSFYVPALLGVRFLPAVIVCFGLTDLIIGFHETILFTWGSILLIGTMSKFFNKYLLSRIGGSLIGAFLFFIITNFGVWTLGSYGYSFNGLLICYTLALPFFAHTLISTFIFSGIIEGLLKFNLFKFNVNN